MKIKARIAVAVDSYGTWYAIGWGWLDESKKDVIAELGYIDEVQQIVGDNVGNKKTHYWVVADLDVPVIEEVKGEVL